MVCFLSIAGLIGLLIPPIAIPLLFCCCGFTCWGIAAGSAAAAGYSRIGPVEAGSGYSRLQSSGATCGYMRVAIGLGIMAWIAAEVACNVVPPSGGTKICMCFLGYPWPWHDDTTDKSTSPTTWMAFKTTTIHLNLTSDIYYNITNDID